MKLLAKATAAAASLTGKRFSLLVASSLVATSGIVAVGMSGSGGLSPMEAAAARALMEEEAAVVTAAPTAAAPEAGFEPTSSPEAVPSAGATTSGSLPAPAPAPAAAPAPAPEAPVVPSSEPEAPEAGPIKHVFLVSLASPGYEAAFGNGAQMPYLAGELRPQGVLLTDYSLLDSAPLPNAFATVAGQPPTEASRAGCPDVEECLYDVETLTLPDQLAGARLSWHGYFEGMADGEGKPDNCVPPDPAASGAETESGYSPSLNPFVFFHTLLDLGDCDENDVPFDELAGDLKKTDATASFSYISPNLCNAGFRGKCPEGAPDGAVAADAFLAKVVPEILASPAYKADGLVIVSFGAADPAPPTDPGTAPEDPRKVGALLLSPLLAPGGTDGAQYNPYSLLRSVEDLFALEPLGKAGGAKVHSFAPAFTAANGGD
jgi:phosphatidylinositol-3-phosphatase